MTESWIIVEDEAMDVLHITSAKREGKVDIASVQVGWDGYIEAEQRQFAHLIAAAPDLLKALGDIADFAESQDSNAARDTSWKMVANTARQWIAKAKGE